MIVFCTEDTELAIVSLSEAKRIVLGGSMLMPTFLFPNPYPPIS